jgi:hypothetical protein
MTWQQHHVLEWAADGLYCSNMLGDSLQSRFCGPTFAGNNHHPQETTTIHKETTDIYRKQPPFAATVCHLLQPPFADFCSLRLPPFAATICHHLQPPFAAFYSHHLPPFTATICHLLQPPFAAFCSHHLPPFAATICRKQPGNSHHPRIPFALNYLGTATTYSTQPTPPTPTPQPLRHPPLPPTSSTPQGGSSTYTVISALTLLRKITTVPSVSRPTFM